MGPFPIQCKPVTNVAGKQYTEYWQGYVGIVKLNQPNISLKPIDKLKYMSLLIVTGYTVCTGMYV